jgi:hypothetical protein
MENTIGNETSSTAVILYNGKLCGSVIVGAAAVNAAEKPL